MHPSMNVINKLIQKFRVNTIFRIFFGNRLYLDGPYDSYKIAKEHSDGYQSSEILEKVYKATEEVLNKKALWERDGTAFYTEKPKLRMLEILSKYYKKGDCIVDFGGGLGGLFLNNQDIFLPNKNLYIIEQENFIRKGLKICSKYNLELNFCDSLLNVKLHPYIVIFSSVLQYIPNHNSIIKSVNELGPKYIFIDRTCFTNRKEIYWWVQQVKNYYSINISYPVCPLNLDSILKLLCHYKLIETWYNSFDPKFPKHRGLLLEKCL